MAGDYIAEVASWLSRQTASHHQLGALAAVVDNSAPNRDTELAAVRAAADRLDALGLIVFYHHTPPALGTAHRDGLRRLAAGERLDVVAQDVERTRPVTIVRTPSGEYAAWYRSPLRLPVGAATVAAGAVIASDPNAALAELRHQARVTAGLDVPPDQGPTHE